jgi:hypothetical protein
MSEPKVLVGCPTSDHKEYCLKEFAKRVKKLSYKNYDVLLIDNSEGDDYAKKIESYGLTCHKVPFKKGVKERLAECRNLLRDKALAGGYDYFLSLEQDIIPPKDIIQRLIFHRAKVVSALYTKLMKVKDGDKDLGMQEVPVLYALEDGQARRMLMEEVKEKKLIPIIGGGLGCVLINRSIFERIKFRVEKDAKGFDDMYFFSDLDRMDVQPLCDTSIHVKHLEQTWDEKMRKS